jgi:predicted nucleotidyltransferase
MPIDKAVLYGSYAKGNASKWSDVDICFFSQAFEDKRDIDVVIELLGMAGKYHPDICFEPNVFPTSEIDNDNPFVKEVLRTGREII